MPAKTTPSGSMWTPTPLTQQAEEALKRHYLSGGHKGLPSPSAVEDCTRQVWGNAVGMPREEPVPAGTVLAMEQGKADEAVAELILRGMGCEIESSQTGLESPEEMGLAEGTLDWIVKYDGDRIVVDSKRMNVYRYTDFVMKGLFEAHRNYYTQLQLYMHGAGCKKGWILGMVADYSAFKGQMRMRRVYDIPPPVWIEEIDYNEVWVESRIRRAHDQRNHILYTKDIAVVPRDFNPKGKDWHCGVCGIRKACIAAGG